MSSNYVLQKAEKSYCPDCNNNVFLLATQEFLKNDPAFYICFECQRIAEVGVRPIEKI